MEDQKTTQQSLIDFLIKKKEEIEEDERVREYVRTHTITFEEYNNLCKLIKEKE